MFQIEEIKKYHELHNEVQDVIDQIVQFYDEIYFKNYEIKNVRSTYDGFLVEVQEWIGGGYHDSEELLITFDLLTNEKLFKQLEQHAKNLKTEREKLREEKEAETRKRKIEEAMNLLKAHGKI